MEARSDLSNANESAKKSPLTTGNQSFSAIAFALNSALSVLLLCIRAVLLKFFLSFPFFLSFFLPNESVFLVRSYVLNI